MSCWSFNRKLYSFNYRAWEELYLESIDLNDSLCSSIRIYSDLNSISRILPKYDFNLELNWINDKTRHLTDVLQLQQFGILQLKNQQIFL